MIDCKNCGFFTNPSNHPIIKLNKCKFDERCLQKKLFTFILSSLKLLVIQLRGDLWAAAVSRDH